jgi:hypothetical protein
MTFHDQGNSVHDQNDALCRRLEDASRMAEQTGDKLVVYLLAVTLEALREIRDRADSVSTRKPLRIRKARGHRAGRSAKH